MIRIGVTGAREMEWAYNLVGQEIELLIHTHFVRFGSDRLNGVPATWPRHLRRFFDPFKNLQLRAAVQSEHLEADHADGDTIAAEKIVHARHSGVDTRTDEQHCHLTLRSVVLPVQQLLCTG